MSSPLDLRSTLRSPRPELLAPAGDRDCITAAVENGADAVYFGLECGFNARARAANLHLDDLPEVMAYLHGRGVRGYVTLNTLVFPQSSPRSSGPSCGSPRRASMRCWCRTWAWCGSFAPSVPTWRSTPRRR